jgi:hypothetical protein
MQELLQLTLYKGTDIRCSNWETCPLSFEQKAYAATDAYAAVKLYQVCWRMAMLCVIATETSLLPGFLALDLRPFLEGYKAACPATTELWSISALVHAALVSTQCSLCSQPP